MADLFCGCGGLTLGVWEAARRNNRRVDILLAIDSDSAPLDVYRANFPNAAAHVRLGDVRDTFSGRRGQSTTPAEAPWANRAGNLDLIVAGPPCQGHSDLNNVTRREDPRNALYLCVVRAGEILRPKVLIVENVPAVRLDRSGVVRAAASWLEDIGYGVVESVIDFARFGVPQRRRRHVLIAVEGGKFDLADLGGVDDPSTPVDEYLQGLEDEPEARTEVFYQPSRMSVENRERVEYLFQNGIYDLPNAMRPACHRDKPHSYISMYGRMRSGRPAQTLTSGFGSMGQGRYVHPTRKRTLTPHEAARLQGFPDFFDFSSALTATSLRRMIANAVPPQFTAMVVDCLIRKELV